MRRRSLFLLVLGATLTTASGADAGDAEAFARVVVDVSELRSGPGISNRVTRTAERGETLPLEGRPGAGYWLEVVLPDGRHAYVLGDEVQTYAVRTGEPGAPSRPGLLAAPPLEGARGGLAIVGGVLSVATDGSRRGSGYLEVRPSVVVHRTVSLDGFVGDAPTSRGQHIVYGGGATFHFAPGWPICPFAGLGGGGVTVVPNADTFLHRRRDFLLARASAGVLFALRGRILVRIEASNMSLFTANSLENAQTYVGGMGVYF